MIEADRTIVPPDPLHHLGITPPEAFKELTSLAIVPVRAIGSPNIGVRAAILLGVLQIAPMPVLAEMHIRGSPEVAFGSTRPPPVRHCRGRSSDQGKKGVPVSII
jgi:hypothetical protein